MGDMRRIIPLNSDWAFNGAKVQLPHSLSEIPGNWFKVSDAASSGSYRKTIMLQSSDIEGRRALLRFEGIGSQARISCNGEPAGQVFGAYTPAVLDITDFLSRKGDYASVTLQVDVSADEDPLIPPYGFKMDYLVFGGIYREASLILVPEHYIKRFSAFGTADGTVFIESELSENGPSSVHILNKEGEEVGFGQISEGTIHIDNPELWDIFHGVLYTAVMEFGEDTVSVRFGFRDAQFRADGFFINGRKVKLLGADRHQSYPIEGYAMPESMQRLDADLIRRTGLNIVRTSHYMQDPAFLDRCDELGILVFEEIPGWQHISQDKLWRDRTEENVRTMIQRDKSHPSIVLWGVRINESADDDELYRSTNSIAHGLDPHRQTGGVRCFEKSHLLEDVYTFNDFSNQGLRSPKQVCTRKCPYLVTEYCGHMFSTKSYDDEEHRLSWALRHARIVNDMYADDSISGCIAWCLFDYNTHDNFGSGDMVCYHGLCDADRIPKLAWYLYASQNSSEPILGLSSFMDEGDHPANTLGKVAVFTNADFVRIHLNDEEIGDFYPASDIYPALPHPPVIIESFIAKRLARIGISSKSDQTLVQKMIDDAKKEPSSALLRRYALPILRLSQIARMKIPAFIKKIQEIQDLAPKAKGIWRFEGVKNGKTVSVQIIDPNGPIVLQATPSQTEFRLSDCPTYQVCQVQLTALKDGCSMRLPYFFDSIEVHASGSMELYGTARVLTIVGGGAAVYLRTRGVGSGQLSISSKRFGEQTIDFNVTR